MFDECTQNLDSFEFHCDNSVYAEFYPMKYNCIVGDPIEVYYCW